jgi:hypothetical protein
MSLSHYEQSRLCRIEASLCRSDPKLAGMLGMFGRLCAGAWVTVQDHRVRRDLRATDRAAPRSLTRLRVPSVMTASTGAISTPERPVRCGIKGNADWSALEPYRRISPAPGSGKISGT